MQDDAYIEFLSSWRNCGIRLAWVGTQDQRAPDEHRAGRTGHFVLLVPVAETLEVMIAGRSFTLAPGEALLMAPETYWYERRQKDTRASIVEHRVFFDVISDQGSAHVLQKLLLPLVAPLPLDDDHEDLWQQLFDAGPIRRRQAQPVDLVPARAAFDQLLASFLRAAFRENRLQHVTTKASPDWFRQLLHDSLPLTSGENSGIDDLIEASGYSRRQVFEAFRRYLDTTPARWIRDHRISRAKARLLTQPGASIRAIAQRCGYADQNLFARHFRQDVGCTPSAWRKRSLE